MKLPTWLDVGEDADGESCGAGAGDEDEAGADDEGAADAGDDGEEDAGAREVEEKADVAEVEGSVKLPDVELGVLEDESIDEIAVSGETCGPGTVTVS